MALQWVSRWVYSARGSRLILRRKALHGWCGCRPLWVRLWRAHTTCYWWLYVSVAALWAWGFHGSTSPGEAYSNIYPLLLLIPLLPRSSAGGLSRIDWDGRCTSGDQPTVSGVHMMARPKGLSLKEMLGKFYLTYKWYLFVYVCRREYYKSITFLDP